MKIIVTVLHFAQVIVAIVSAIGELMNIPVRSLLAAYRIGCVLKGAVMKAIHIGHGSQ